MSACKGCKAEIVWAVMADTGSKHPLDAQPPLDVPQVGHVAFNPKTEGAVLVNADNLLEAVRWEEHGVTFHTSHFATCPESDKFRKRSS
jgi:hypothetical protein